MPSVSLIASQSAEESKKRDTDQNTQIHRLNWIFAHGFKQVQIMGVVRRNFVFLFAPENVLWVLIVSWQPTKYILVQRNKKKFQLSPVIMLPGSVLIGLDVCVCGGGWHGGYQVINFLYLRKHMLWVLIRSTSVRCFWWVQTTYVLVEK